jgi:hypothetical protein
MVVTSNVCKHICAFFIVNDAHLSNPKEIVLNEMYICFKDYT